MFTTAEGIKSLDPTAEFSITEDVITWHTTPIDEALIQAEVTRLQTEYDSQQYARDRASAYPPVTDYLDGIVKGDTAQVDKYISDCQAVKLKYPKGA